MGLVWGSFLPPPHLSAVPPNLFTARVAACPLQPQCVTLHLSRLWGKQIGKIPPLTFLLTKPAQGQDAITPAGEGISQGAPGARHHPAHCPAPGQGRPAPGQSLSEGHLLSPAPLIGCNEQQGKTPSVF